MRIYSFFAPSGLVNLHPAPRFGAFLFYALMIDGLFVGTGKIGSLNVSIRGGKVFLSKKKTPISRFRPFPVNDRYLVHKTGYVFDKLNDLEHVSRVKIGDDFFVNLIFDKNEKPVPFLVAEVVLITFKGGYSIGDGHSMKSGPDVLSAKRLKTIPRAKSGQYEYSEIERWGCNKKSEYANTRVLTLRPTDGSITPTDVFECLIRASFKCFYCGDALCCDNWHLDHVIPVSRGGRNDRLNITPACVDCNLMKHSLMPERFIEQVGKIYKNYNP